MGDSAWGRSPIRKETKRQLKERDEKEEVQEQHEQLKKDFYKREKARRDAQNGS